MNQRLNELDGLRGLAALSVFIGHVIGMLVFTGLIFDVFNQTILHVLWDGYAAVILFFVLSGFVLALPFVNNTERKINYLSFMIKRVFRLYPAFILIIVISLLLKNNLFFQESFKGLSPWINSFWLLPVTFKDFVNTIVLIGPGYDTGLINPVIWSLKIEMRMSLIFPLIIIGVRFSKSHFISFLFLLITFLLGLFVSVDTLLFLPMFVLGAILAKHRFELGEILSTTNLPTKIILFVISLFLYTSMFSIPGISDSHPMIGTMLIALGSSIFILLSLNVNKARKYLNSKIIKFLGDVSYSFYLIHFPVLLSITSISIKFHIPIVVGWILSLGVSLYLSYYSYKYIEIPFQSLGRKIAKLTEIKKDSLLKQKQIRVKEAPLD